MVEQRLALKVSVEKSTLTPEQREHRRQVALIQHSPEAAKQIINHLSTWLAEQFPDDPSAPQLAAVAGLIDRLDSLRLQAADESNYWRGITAEVERQRDQLAYEIDTRNETLRSQMLHEVTRDIALTLNLTPIETERLIEALRGDHADLLGRFTMADIEDFAKGLAEQVADGLVPEDFDDAAE